VGRNIEKKEQQKTRNCKWYSKQQRKLVFKRPIGAPFMKFLLFVLIQHPGPWTSYCTPPPPPLIGGVFCVFFSGVCSLFFFFFLFRPPGPWEISGPPPPRYRLVFGFRSFSRCAAPFVSFCTRFIVTYFYLPCIFKFYYW